MSVPHWEAQTTVRGRRKDGEQATCICGAKISRHNPGLLCAVCDKIHRQATLLDSKADRERLAARHVAGIYTRPEVFGSPEHYLQELTKALDNMAGEIGIDRFDPTKAEWWPTQEEP